ncbi:hypothetical protein Tco_1310287 [Tanacetum coccineum]
MSKVKKKKKGVIIFSEVGSNKDNNPNGMFNDGGEVGYNKADGTWAPALRIEDGWYLFDGLGLSKEPHSKSNLDVHLQFHVDRQDIDSQDVPLAMIQKYLRMKAVFATKFCVEALKVCETSAMNQEIKDLERTVKEHEHYINEHESIMQALRIPEVPFCYFIFVSERAQDTRPTKHSKVKNQLCKAAAAQLQSAYHK